MLDIFIRIYIYNVREKMNTIISTLINIFNTTVDQIKNYGKGIVLWATLLVLFIGMFIFFLRQNDQLFDRVIDQRAAQAAQTELKHTEQVQDRRVLNVTVYNILNKFFYGNSNVCDIAVMEHHNGTLTLNGRKSFLYISNTFELCRFNDTHYNSAQHINMSLFNIYNIMYSRNYRLYYNTIEDLKRDDMKLYSIVHNIKDAQYIYIVELIDINDISVASLFIVTNDNTYNSNFANEIKVLSNNISLLLL